MKDFTYMSYNCITGEYKEVTKNFKAKGNWGKANKISFEDLNLFVGEK